MLNAECSTSARAAAMARIQNSGPIVALGNPRPSSSEKKELVRVILDSVVRPGDVHAARCRAVLKGRTGLTFVQENPTRCTAHQLVWLLYHLRGVKAVHALERANVLARAPEMLRRYPQELCSLLSPAISP